LKFKANPEKSEKKTSGHYYFATPGRQSLKCKRTQGNVIPRLQYMVQSVLPPQIVTLLEKFGY